MMSAKTGTAIGAQIHRGFCDDLHVIEIKTPVVSEFHITAVPKHGEHFSAAVGRLAQVLQAIDATVVRQIIFGAAKACPAALEILRREVSDPHLPVTWVEGAACDGGDIAGIQVHAVRGVGIKTYAAGQAVARVWDDGLARHCVCNNALPARNLISPTEQACEVFQALQTGLASAGMGLNDVARTWFYLNGILTWYDGFNHVRNGVFAEGGIRCASAPASTGIGARNPSGRALTGVAWAVRANNGQPVVDFVASPRQCPAPKYGSAFSRAVEIRGGGFRQLLVSGTASIAPDGRTEHPGDTRAQIELSMQVAEAILASRGMTFTDVSRATAYFRSPVDAPLFSGWLARRGLQGLPVVSTRCDICRDDLLFEIELDAVGLD
jgi:enamine deaminase RidA (YjgF/YER057c/UK114 family)